MLSDSLKGLMAIAIAAILAAPTVARADELSGGNSSRELRAKYDKETEGKTVAWVPVALGVPLTDEWTAVMTKEAADRGYKFLVRDPNFNATAELQAVSALIDQHPDVLIVHNPNVQILAKELKRAEEAGIHVIQVNMVSNYKTDAYVGADWFQIGRMVGEDIVKECGTGSGKSGKVQIVQGELTSAASLEQLNGTMEALNKDKAIKVVSNQAANWDATKALDITATVIQQHPDLCASFGFWGVMEGGASQALKAAGKLDQVKVYASGGGSRFNCDQLDNGGFYKFLSYTAPVQAHDIMQTASFLMQTGQKPGAMRMAVYTKPEWITKDIAKENPGVCYDLPKKN
ncbi:MAG TPA: sugar ABC transporter substrate-binding protein [Stellaceae bacterium]|nr:sugar ABC transporter substrate-binding protein [Stellaceae bacterium]